MGEKENSTDATAYECPRETSVERQLHKRRTKLLLQPLHTLERTLAHRKSRGCNGVHQATRPTRMRRYNEHAGLCGDRCAFALHVLHMLHTFGLDGTGHSP